MTKKSIKQIQDGHPDWPYPYPAQWKYDYEFIPWQGGGLVDHFRQIGDKLANDFDGLTYDINPYANSVRLKLSHPAVPLYKEDAFERYFARLDVSMDPMGTKDILTESTYLVSEGMRAMQRTRGKYSQHKSVKHPRDKTKNIFWLNGSKEEGRAMHVNYSVVRALDNVYIAHVENFEDDVRRILQQAVKYSQAA